jgi:hypothetical protein
LVEELDFGVFFFFAEYFTVFSATQLGATGEIGAIISLNPIALRTRIIFIFRPKRFGGHSYLEVL